MQLQRFAWAMTLFSLCRSATRLDGRSLSFLAMLLAGIGAWVVARRG